MRADLERGQERLAGDVLGDRRHEGAPGARALGLVEPGQVGGPVGLVAFDAGRVHQPPDDRCARLARCRDPGDDQRPQPLRVADREPERGHPAHRVADEVERDEAQGVDERREVVDQPLGAEPARDVPAGRARGRARPAG